MINRTLKLLLINRVKEYFWIFDTGEEVTHIYEKNSFKLSWRNTAKLRLGVTCKNFSITEVFCCVFFRIWTEHEKIQTRKKYIFGHFHAVRPSCYVTLFFFWIVSIYKYITATWLKRFYLVSHTKRQLPGHVFSFRLGIFQCVCLFSRDVKSRFDILLTYDIC